MTLQKVLDTHTDRGVKDSLKELLRMPAARQTQTVRGKTFWNHLSSQKNVDDFLDGFLKLPPKTQSGALTNPCMWQTIEPRVAELASEREKGVSLTDKTKRRIETILIGQTPETLKYVFIMPSFLQMLAMNDMHSDVIMTLKLAKLKENVMGTTREKKIFAHLFDALVQTPQGRALLQEGVTCFQTRYLFDNAAKYAAHWQKTLRLCAVSKINTPLDGLENNPALFKYALEHLYHELLHMNQCDDGCRQNAQNTLLEKFIAYRLMELETAVTAALPGFAGGLTREETPSKKMTLYYTKRYLSWLTQKHGGDEQKAKTAFAKQLWSNAPDMAYEEAPQIQKIFKAWNKKYNLQGLLTLNGSFGANVQACLTRLHSHLDIQASDSYFLDSKNLSLALEIPSCPFNQDVAFRILNTLQESQNDPDKSDRFLVTALSMEKALEKMTPSKFNGTFDYCLKRFGQTQNQMYLKGIMHILLAENFKNPEHLKKVKDISPLQTRLQALRGKNSLPQVLKPARGR